MNMQRVNGLFMQCGVFLCKGLRLQQLSFASKESRFITALLLGCIQSVSNVFRGGPGVSFSAYKVSFLFEDKKIHLIRQKMRYMSLLASLENESTRDVIYQSLTLRQGTFLTGPINKGLNTKQSYLQTRTLIRICCEPLV